MPADTIPQRLLAQARLRPEQPAYFTREGGRWISTSWLGYAAQVRRAGRAMMALGLQPGQTVCILGWNRPEWVIFDVAAMAVGAAPAGIYTTCSKEEVQYIVNHAASPIVLLENDEQWQKIKAERERLPHLKHVVMMKGAEPIDDPMVLSWDAFMSYADKTVDADFLARVDALEPAGLATLIYTSGTTGPPKGVMLSHGNLAWTALIARDLVSLTATDRTISYLPLSHIAEQMFSIHGPITTGSRVYYAESIAKLPDNLKEVEPTVFFGVPRIWEKFHAGIRGKLSEVQGPKKKLVDWARGVATAYHNTQGSGGTPAPALEVQYRAAYALVFKKLKGALGLGKLRVAVSGAAPIAAEVLEFFQSLDIPVCEVYGQSEGTGPTSFNTPRRRKLGSVGPALPGVEVKIADDGEILVKGPNVFLGYFKEPEATAETLRDGYLCSGDLGTFDRDGFLSITGRKKEIIITAGGKNIAPKNIEAAIKNHPLVGEAVVIGDRRKFLTALVAIDPEALKKFGEARGVSDMSADHQAVHDELQKVIDEVNATLARVETVKRFKIVPRPFSIENGELTPTLKVKRRKVNENFSELIESMYRE